MPLFAKLLHLAAAAIWLGGMAFMLLALRPALGSLAPAQRLPLLAHVLTRFFALVWICLAVLLLTGGYLMHSGAATPGVHAMLGIGLLMAGIFAYLYGWPFRALKRAVAAQDWPAAGRAASVLPRLVWLNFVLGWVAVVAVRGGW